VGDDESSAVLLQSRLQLWQHGLDIALLWVSGPTECRQLSKDFLVEVLIAAERTMNTTKTRFFLCLCPLNSGLQYLVCVCLEVLVHDILPERQRQRISKPVQDCYADCVLADGLVVSCGWASCPTSIRHLSSGLVVPGFF
jgi:hypothetical protein